MPITNYDNTIIYKIVCNDLNVKDCYIGHTINMTKRKCCHKSRCHNEKDKHYNLKIYQIIRQNGGWSNWSMILVETFPCKDKNEACKREREVYEELDAKLNMLRPYRTQEDLKEYDKKYYQINKKEINEYHEKYYQNNKEDLKEYDKKYYQINKKERNQKIQCEFCKKLLSKCSMYRHHTICKCKE